MAASKIPALDKSFHEVSGEGNQLFICPTCVMDLISASGFRRHMLAHGDKLYKCLICTKTLTERQHYEIM